MGFAHVGSNVLISAKASIYNAEKISIGDNSRIDDFVVVSGRVTIGRNVHIAVFSNLAGGEEGIEMEDFSGLAYGCQVFSQSDDYTGSTLTNPTVPDSFKNVAKAKVRIGRHVIVGASSIVFPGVHIQEGTSVGAMAVVTKTTEPWSIYVGNPARKFRDRKRDLLELEKQYLEDNGE